MIEDYKKAISEILDNLRVKPGGAEERLYAVHYTGSAVPELMLAQDGDNTIRQYDSEYMNDPDEGRFIIDLMIDAVERSESPNSAEIMAKLRRIRSARLLVNDYRRATFLSCWTTSVIRKGKEHEADSLNHWRFYGKNGEGACIAIPMTNLVTALGQIPLYKVEYGKRIQGGGAGAKDRPIRQFNDALVAAFKSLPKTPANALRALDEIVEATVPLLFLFKSDDYSSEAEVRSIVHVANHSYSEGVRFDEQVPRRAYVNGGQDLIDDGTIVFFGPRADRALAISLMGRVAERKLDVKVLMSERAYR